MTASIKCTVTETHRNPGGLLCGYGYSASVRPEHGLFDVVSLIARVFLWRQFLSVFPGGKRALLYSINLMRARHPAWFLEDLERLFAMLAKGEIRPSVAERVAFADVIDAHRRIEAGGLDGKLVLCPS